MILSKVLKLILLSTLFTYNVIASEIQHNRTNLGSILHFPVYYAIQSAGWHTKLRITNTNLHKSVVAKLVFREGVNAVKKLDMLLYLGPTDVFDADIREKDGVVSLATVDNSHNLHVGDLDGRVTQNDEDEIVVAFEEATEINGYMQNNLFGSIEVYALVDNNSSEVEYSIATCERSGIVKFGRDNSVTGITCSEELNCTTPLDEAGVDHEAFVKAAHMSVSSTKMGENGWSEAQGGLYGEAIIMADNENGHLAMAYMAKAFEKVSVNSTQPYSDVVTPAAQKNQDTNLLMYNDASLIKSMEDVIAKEATYVTHYARDGRLATKENTYGDMAETRMLASFLTKVYSVEHYSYVTSSPYSTYGINYAGGNLFYYEFMAYTQLNVINRYVYLDERGRSSNNYGDIVSIPCGGSIAVVSDNLPCNGRTDHYAIVSLDMRVESPFADGYINYTLSGASQRTKHRNYTMPYIPIVMSAVSFKDGTNVTNIKYPASKKSTITRLGEVTFYSTDSATSFDVTPDEDGAVK